jgi:hypothetical protein
VVESARREGKTTIALEEIRTTFPPEADDPGLDG